MLAVMGDELTAEELARAAAEMGLSHEPRMGPAA